MIKNYLNLILVVFTPLFLHAAYRITDDVGQISSSSYRPKNWLALHNGKIIRHSHLVDLVVDDYPEHFASGARKLLKESPHGPEILDAYRSTIENRDQNHLKSLMIGEGSVLSSDAPNPAFVRSIFSKELVDRVLGTTVSQGSSFTDNLFNSSHSSSISNSIDSLSNMEMNDENENDGRPVGSYLRRQDANKSLTPPLDFSSDDEK